MVALFAMVLVSFAAVAAPAAPALWTKPRLLDGPWRDELGASGLSVDAAWTQFYQGPASGEGNGGGQYGGKADLFLGLDGGKLGLWKGLTVSLHAEFLYGEDANSDGSGSLLPANTAMALPRLGGHDEDLSVLITQSLSKRVSMTVGKFNMLDVLGRTPLLGGGGGETFMNMAMAAPITGVTPPYLFGANVVVKTDPVTWTFFVYDPRSAQDFGVLETWLDAGATGMIAATVPYSIDGHTGILGLKAIYSNRNSTDLADIPELILPPGSESSIGTKDGSWFFSVSFQQYLVQNSSNPQEGWGIYGLVGISDGNPNPLEWSALFGVAGTSFLKGRNLDRWGVGYFRYSLSSDLRDGFGTIGLDLRDEQGVELFYSVAVTPWFSVTGDVQVVEPLDPGASTAVTAGLRTRIRL